MIKLTPDIGACHGLVHPANGVQGIFEEYLVQHLPLCLLKTVIH